MYSNRFVAAIKVAGKILRENQGVVALPFGCEYSILLKNLEARRALVSVSVDGQSATDGTLVINPNSSIDLERFIRNSNLERGSRFKFIERTAAIEAHRGVTADDGLVRVEFQFEQQVAVEEIIRRHYFDRWPGTTPKPWPHRPPWEPQTMKSSVRSRAMRASTPPVTLDCSAMNVSQSPEGITVAGSESSQRFVNVQGFPVETAKYVIVLQLRGQVGDVKIASPVTVEVKPQCVTCGRTNKATNKFCSECGTSLQVY